MTSYAGGNASATDTKPPQVHEGFSEALGLPLQTSDGSLLFKPTHTRYYHTDGDAIPMLCHLLQEVDVSLKGHVSCASQHSLKQCGRVHLLPGWSANCACQI